jgi:hypothetical protein
MAGMPDGVTPEMVDLTRTGEPAEWFGTRVPVPFSTMTADAIVAAGGGRVPEAPHPTFRQSEVVRHLVALDALQPTTHLLRFGWVVVAGTAAVGGQERQLCLPLMSQPVQIASEGWLAGDALRNGIVRPRGPAELTPLVSAPDVAAHLEAEAQFGGGALAETFAGQAGAALIARLPKLQRWIRDVVEAAGLPPVRAVLPPSENPLDHRSTTARATGWWRWSAASSTRRATSSGPASTRR